MPLLGDPGHRQLVTSLQDLAGRIPRPSAILLISAHWEAPVATITNGELPELIYDYSGFPEAAYHIQYPCPGSPELADQLYDALRSANIQVNLNDYRGYDHGMFVPLKIMYPGADIPCIQLSLLDSLDSEQHLSLGQALQSVEWENLLVIGSGASFHNLNAFFSHDPKLNEKNQQFMEWLRDTLSSELLSDAERRQQLAQWKNAPFAEYCHPREEHLLPLHVCYGMAGTTYRDYVEVTISGCKSAMFVWQKIS